MKAKNETDSLNELIITMEKKRAYELNLLKDQLHLGCESLRPLNLIKHVLHDVTDSSEVKHNFVNSAIGLGTGFLSKKLLIRDTHNPIKKVLGNLLQFGVAKIVSKHTDDFKSIGRNLLKRFFNSDKAKKV
jgi:hypothetical protein